MLRLTSLEAVEDLLKVPLSEDAEAQVNALIEEASAIVEEYCGREFTEPVPEKIGIVVRRMVARTINSSASAEAVPIGASGVANTAGVFSRQFQFPAGSTDGGVWLAKLDKQILRRFRRGAFTVRTW